MISLRATKFNTVAHAGLPAYCDSVGTAKKCHCKRNVNVFGIFSIRRSFYGHKNCRCTGLPNKACPRLRDLATALARGITQPRTWLIREPCSRNVIIIFGMNLSLSLSLSLSFSPSLPLSLYLNFHTKSNSSP